MVGRRRRSGPLLSKFAIGCLVFSAVIFALLIAGMIQRG
jgi:hypothetical protein